MIALFVAAQVADLASFLIATHLHPELVRYEVGLIGAVLLAFGPFVAAVYKTAGVALIAGCAHLMRPMRPAWASFVLGAGTVAGLVGLTANMVALTAVR